eukprot:5235912-Karenia_brevis.AAC.1
MFLFRPWRQANAAVKMWLENGQHLRLPEGPYTSDIVWNAVYEEYLRWYTDEIESIAAPFFQRAADTLQFPIFDTKDVAIDLSTSIT